MRKTLRFPGAALRTCFVVFCAMLGVVSFAASGDYPDHSIRLIVPFPPGGPNDILARLVGQRLSSRLGQGVVVDNRPGASTIIGTEIAARAPADGYTLLMVSPSHVINPGLRASMPYDLLKDFTPVIEVAVSPNVLVVNPTVQVKNVADLLALAKARPGEINYGSGGTGTATHLAGVMLSQMGGVTMNHIPYKGDGPAMTDLLGNRISWMFGTILSVKPYIDSGRVRALAVSGSTRVSVLPDVPTVAETIPGFEATSLYGVMAPAGTPSAIISKLNTELAAILASPEFRQRLAKDGTQVVGGTPEDFESQLRTSIAKWTGVIRAAHIKPE